MPDFLEERHAFQTQVLSRTKSNLQTLDRQLVGYPACSRLQAEGGWYATLRIPATTTDEDFALRLLEQHDVYVHPGHFFDFPRDGYLVISLITPEAEFADGVRRLLELAS